MVARILVSVVCIVGVKPCFLWQSAGNAEIAMAGISYLRICMQGSLAMLGQWVYDPCV